MHSPPSFVAQRHGTAGKIEDSELFERHRKVKKKKKSAKASQKLVYAQDRTGISAFSRTIRCWQDEREVNQARNGHARLIA